ncbi:hypothetical protein HN264_20055, partial [Acinetobacter baumannii]|nr:hypothetical protein [Acinetobacter baumannii]MBF6907572.1 hypothetical protein [Acinetobacter baumannii]
KALPIKCLPQSFYRRMQRFFAGQYFDYRQISQLIFNMFSPDQPKSVVYDIQFDQL